MTAFTVVEARGIDVAVDDISFEDGFCQGNLQQKYLYFLFINTFVLFFFLIGA